MPANLQGIVDVVGAHSALVYGLVVLLSLSESLPLIGAVIPGTALIVGVSALVPTGAVALWPLLLCATFGAVAGDGLAYWLGHRYRDPITSRWPFSRYPQLVPRGKAYCQRHGGKSILLARFTPAVRAVVPLVAGILNMPARRFYTVNIVSALLWAPSHILAGALLGASVTLAGAVAGRLAVLLLLLLGTLWLVIWATRLALRHGLPVVAAAQQRLWRWARARNTWMSRPLLALLDPARVESKGLVLAGSLLVGTAWTFLGILEDVVSGDPLVRADKAVYRFLQGLRTAWGDRVMIGVTELGDGAVTAPLTVVVLAWLLWRRAGRAAAYWVCAVTFAAVFTTIMKIAVHARRPALDIYSGWSAFSFPSGHTTVNTTLYGFLAFLIAREARPRWRGPVIAFAALTVTSIGFSRLYLGAHWFSDVAAGLAFGIAWVTVLAIAYARHYPPPLPAARLVAIVAAVLVIAGGLHVSQRYPVDVQRYAVREETRVLTASDWWTRDWRELPARRADLAGEWEEPLTVQWAGDLQGVEHELLAKGWKAPVPWSFPGGIIAWLAPHPRPAELPVLPQLQGGRPPALTLLHPEPDGSGLGSRLVLRLWATGIALPGGPEDRLRPLWIGTVVRQQLERPFSLLTILRTGPGFDGPRDRLAAALADTRLVQRVPQSRERGWDGRVLLARAAAIAVEILSETPIL